MVGVDELLAELSPRNLRDRFAHPHDAWREEFKLRFLTTESHDEMMSELTRLVCHLMQRWFGDRIAWPAERGRMLLVSILDRELGEKRTVGSGQFEAMKTARWGSGGGMRALSELVSRALLVEHVDRYLDAVVLPRIYELSVEENLALAREYLARFNVVPELELDSPASVVLRWRQIIRQHARRVVFG